MRKTIACLLVLALSFIGCSTMTNVRGIREFHSPMKGNVQKLGIRITCGSGIDKDAVSVDRVTDLPIKKTLEVAVEEEVPIPGTLIIALIISCFVRDVLDSMPIFVGSGI